MARFSSQTSALLKGAGWFDGRRDAAAVQMGVVIASEGGFAMNEAATRVLLEFGALHIGTQGPGERCARSSIDLTPTLAGGEEDRFSMWRTDQRPRLFPLGEIDGGHAFLALDPDGSVYAVGDEYWRIASTFDEALEVFMRGLHRERVSEIPTLPRA
jgi:hypothetical protein